MTERISNIIDRITDPIYKYRKRKEEAAQAAARESKMKDVMAENQKILENSIKNCPQGHILLVKLHFGYWANEDLHDAIPKLVSRAVKQNDYAYLLGSGLIALDPDLYQRDPAKIAEVLWAPHTQLDGSRIYWCRFVERGN